MAGRPNKYLTDVRPRFDEIRGWVKEGITDKDIAKLLGINKSTLVDYKNKYPELNELMKTERQKNVEELKKTLYKKAMGFQYTETEVTEDAEGNVKRKTITKTALPSETAILILLKHWDKDEEGKPKWMNDPATFKLKTEELQFKKESFENNNW